MMAYNNNKQLLRARTYRVQEWFMQDSGIVEGFGEEGWMTSNLHEPRFA